MYDYLARYSAADLAFTAVLLFGGYNLGVILSWLRDRHTLRHCGQPEQ